MNTFRTLLTLLLILLPGAHTRAADAEDIARQLYPDEVTSLMVGDDSMPVLVSPPYTPLTRGTAVVFYESGITAGNTGLTLDIASQLTGRLNGAGWQTVLVPSMLTPLTTATDTTTLPADSPVHPRTDSMQVAIDYVASRNTTMLQLAALNRFLRNADGYRMLIAQGMTATLLLDSADNESSTPPDTMVVLSPFWPERERNLTVPEMIARTSFPVLDIALNDFNNWALATRFLRERAATTALKLHYRQRPLSSLGSSVINAGTASLSGAGMRTDVTAQNAGFAGASPFAVRLAGRIYGWITYLGW
ncbi:DUF3530 family protein [Alteromonas sp. CYL-A6]|uniref:DUF3530 family protein n=1 Tax=Alteromonas nitratireducens TaxID=3390813 RepID=UPI0034AADFB9